MVKNWLRRRSKFIRARTSDYGMHLIQISSRSPTKPLTHSLTSGKSRPQDRKQLGARAGSDNVTIHRSSSQITTTRSSQRPTPRSQFSWRERGILVEDSPSCADEPTKASSASCHGHKRERRRESTSVDTDIRRRTYAQWSVDEEWRSSVPKYLVSF